MLYRILRDLGCMDSSRRQAAIRMARGLPWEDLEQFLAFYDRARQDARRNALDSVVDCSNSLAQAQSFLFKEELRRYHLLLPAACVAAAIPVSILLSYLGSKMRGESGLSTVLNEIDDPVFVPVSLGMLSDKHADSFSFRTDLFRAIGRLLPEISVEQSREWTPEERYALCHGLHVVLPSAAGGRDSLSHSPNDFALVILKVLQRIGDSRELDLVRLVSTIDPITEQHQTVREASVKCIKSIEKRLQESPSGSALAEAAKDPLKPIRLPVPGVETDVRHLLKAGIRSTRSQPHP